MARTRSEHGADGKRERGRKSAHPERDPARRTPPESNLDAGGEPIANGRNSGRASAETRRNEQA